MAGRGVDIILGGNPSDQVEAEQVRASGGLHVIGTERHEARRIDNQLRGRSGRQGDAGSSRFYIGLDDELMRLFSGQRIAGIMDRLGIDESTPIEHPLVTRQIESAQKKVEQYHFDVRKHVLEYDDVMNVQRKVIYGERRKVLAGENVRDTILDIIERLVLLQTIDRKWIDHLYNMDSLREGIGLRAYAQVSPLIEYQREGYDLFQQMLADIQEETVKVLLRVELGPAEGAPASSPRPASRRPVPVAVGAPGAAQPSGTRGSVAARDGRRKLGRNHPCWCGGGET